MEIQYCTLTDRLKAMLIDACCMMMVMLLFSTILDKTDKPLVWLRILMFMVIWVLYEPICIAYGCTIGQYLMHIRVRSIRDTKKHIHIVLSYMRYIIKFVFGWLSFLSIAINQQRQAIHDMAVESVVIKV